MKIIKDDGNGWHIKKGSTTSGPSTLAFEVDEEDDLEDEPNLPSDISSSSAPCPLGSGFMFTKDFVQYPQ